MEMDRRLVDAASTILRDGNAKVYKSTRSGFTTSIVIAAKEMGKRILCVVPTNRISDETVNVASKGSAVSVRANHDCMILDDEIKNDKFLGKLPLPLPPCNNCFCLNWCPVTKILGSDEPVITLTYSKLIALLLSKSSIAKRILKKLSVVDIVFFDEAHIISLPTVIRIPAFCEIEIPDGYECLSSVISKFIELNENHSNEIRKLEAQGREGHVGRHFNQWINNDNPLSFRQISATYNELVNLAKRRKELGIDENDILAIRDIIGLMSSSRFALNYIKKNDGVEGGVYITGNFWIAERALGEFLQGLDWAGKPPIQFYLSFDHRSVWFIR